MKRYLFVALFVLLFGIACFASPAKADNPWGGSITICTVKQPNGILRQCTPTPGAMRAQVVTPTVDPQLKAIDAAYAELSAFIGHIVIRNGGDSTYSIIPYTFPDTGLGCPIPGHMYIQIVRDGYIILIVYAGHTYDFRATVDGYNTRLCSVS